MFVARCLVAWQPRLSQVLLSECAAPICLHVLKNAACGLHGAAQPSNDTSFKWDQVGRGGGSSGRRREPGSSASKMSERMRKFADWFERLIFEQRHKEAVEALAHIMREGMQEAASTPGREGTMSVEYRPSLRMLDDYVHLLLRLHRQHVQVMDPQNPARTRLQVELCRQLEEAVHFRAAAGFPPSTVAYSNLVRAYKDIGNADKAQQCMNTMLQQGMPVGMSVRLYVVFALLSNGKHKDAWSELSTALKTPLLEGSSVEQQMMTGSAHTAASRLLKQALWERNWGWVQDIQECMAAFDPSYKPDAQIHMEMMVTAAQNDDIGLAESSLVTLRSQYQRSLSPAEGWGKREVDIKVDEGALLAVLNAAVRNVQQHPKVVPGLAEMAFELLEKSLATPNYHHPSYYQSIQVEAANDSQPPPVPAALRLPTTYSYHAMIQLYVQLGDWTKAFVWLEKLEAAHGQTRPTTLSPYHGLSYFTEALSDESRIAAAYDQLTRRTTSQSPVTAAMLNLVLRALARFGSVDNTAKLFEEYKTAGIKQDVDSFNAVIESCALAKQVDAVASLVEFMQSQGVEPNEDTYDLMLNAHIAVEDCEGVVSTLQLMSRNANDRVQIRHKTRLRARQLAARFNHHLLRQRLSAL